MPSLYDHALDRETEHVIYEELLNHLPKTAFVSVTHSEALAHFQSRTFDLRPVKGS